MPSHNEVWPTCDRCGRRITVHYLWGHVAYCDATRNAESRASFTVRQVNDVRRALGLPIGRRALDLENREHAS